MRRILCAGIACAALGFVGGAVDGGFAIHPPTAIDDAVTTPKDTPVIIPIVMNDLDEDLGDVLALDPDSLTQPANGIVWPNADGTVTYVPAPAFVGEDSFTYSVTDGTFTSAPPAMVLVTVTEAENAPPVAEDDSAFTLRGTPVIVPVLGNDSDPDDDALAVTAVTVPLHGSVLVNPDGTLTYTPVAGFLGDDTFTYTVSDGRGGTATADCTVRVLRISQAWFITGGGWFRSPAGAYAAHPDAVGKLHVQFAVKRRLGALLPVGTVEFRLQGAQFRFRSTAVTWLAVDGQAAACAGTGRVNGQGGYAFLLSCVDGKRMRWDRLRLKVWDIETGDVVYDNQPADADGAAATFLVTHGSIVVHRG